MTKQDLIVKLVEELKANEIDVNQKTADVILKSVCNVITTGVSAGEKLSIPGFGSFEPQVRAARIARSPATGQEIQVPEKTVPKFKAASAFKNAVIEAHKK